MKRQLKKPGMSCRCLIGLAIFFFCTGLHAAEKPNVLFIAVDDLNDWIGVLEGHPLCIFTFYNIDR